MFEKQIPLNHRLMLSLAVLFSVGAVARGSLLDAQPEITQPQLFWSFLVLGLGGALLGWRFGMRHDPHVGRNLLALFGVLLAWRLSYFPMMVMSGWNATLLEYLTWHALGISIVYPTFLLTMFATNLVIGAIAAAAVAKPQTPLPETGRWLWLRKRIHAPPRKLLWLMGVVALPVAFLTSFSWPSDYVLFADHPWHEPREVPAIGEPHTNAYREILAEYGDEMGLGSKVLALNAALTYPLVPDSPWADAIKGTLEDETRARPLASSWQRTDEHYLAYLAAHKRVHEAAK